MYILNLGRISRTVFEYFIFNSVKKDKVRVEMMPMEAERIRRRFGLVPITKTQAEQMKLNEFKEVEI